MIRLITMSLFLLVVGPGVAFSETSTLDAALVGKAKKAVDRGLRFLRETQAEDGSYGKHVGLTGMTLLAFGESHRKYTYEDGPFIGRAADWLAKQARADGAITGDATPTYNTALAIMALQSADAKRFGKEIKGGQDFLVRFQSDEERKYKEADKFYGGIGYGGDERPDLSNLHYALEALKKTDYDAKSDVWAKAQKFISRCQNRSESNDQPWAGNDGGFVYAPGQSFAGGTTSYGAMSFAGLKSLMFTRAKKDDPRVQAVLKWIQKNYDFTIHPGMDTTSYFYYLQTAAEALRAYGEPHLKDARGRTRTWTRDLVERMLQLQKKDGSWVNSNKKYWEGNPLLATARSIITLNHALRSAGAVK
jgi:squalene-hopene/tetraprenyl-beta-curcumene cyclase